jgi:hypothetical protein
MTAFTQKFARFTGNNRDILIACLISTAAFLLLYGIKILNPYYEEWLLVGGDLSQTHIAWLFYLNSPWHYPLGVLYNIFYPYAVGVSQFNPIPLFALFFKIFSFLFNGDFQYIGLFGFITFILQPVFAVLILRKATNSALLRIVGALFIIFAPIMLYRPFHHLALASHWLILAALYLGLIKYDNLSVRYEIAKWSFLMVLAVLIFPYFNVMLAGILAFSVLAGIKRDKLTLLRSAALFAIPCAVGLLTIKIIGVLADTDHSQNFTQWENSFNLNAFFNPLGWSAVLPTLKHAIIYQYEGFAYLGLGTIILLAAAVMLTIYQWVKDKKTLREIFNKKTLIIIAMALSFVLLSTGGLISFGEHVILHIRVPNIKYINFFRSTGRFIWPTVYIIIFFSLFKLLSVRKIKLILPFILLCAAIQLFDIKGGLVSKHREIKTPLVVDIGKFEPLKGALEGFEHITFLGYENAVNMDQLYNIAYFAVKNQLSINDFYSDRKPKKINQYIAYQIDKYSKGEFEKGTFYIINNLYLKRLDFPVYKMGDLYFSTSEPLEGLTPMTIDEYPWKLSNDILPKNNRFLRRGADIENGRILAQGGFSFGPRLAVGSGMYRIDIIGQNLSAVRFGAASGVNNNIRHSILEHTPEKISYIALLPSIPDAEFIIINDGINAALINSMTINAIE